MGDEGGPTSGGTQVEVGLECAPNTVSHQLVGTQSQGLVLQLQASTSPSHPMSSSGMQFAGVTPGATSVPEL